MVRGNLQHCERVHLPKGLRFGQDTPLGTRHRMPGQATFVQGRMPLSEVSADGASPKGEG